MEYFVNVDIGGLKWFVHVTFDEFNKLLDEVGYHFEIEVEKPEVVSSEDQNILRYYAKNKFGRHYIGFQTIQ